jgi:hypothetical protein
VIGRGLVDSETQRNCVTIEKAFGRSLGSKEKKVNIPSPDFGFWRQRKEPRDASAGPRKSSLFSLTVLLLRHNLGSRTDEERSKLR